MGYVKLDIKSIPDKKESIEISITEIDMKRIIIEIHSISILKERQVVTEQPASGDTEKEQDPIVNTFYEEFDNSSFDIMPDSNREYIDENWSLRYDSNKSEYAIQRFNLEPGYYKLTTKHVCSLEDGTINEENLDTKFFIEGPHDWHDYTFNTKYYPQQ
tara:strand:- start:116 stop:592 length:477 start_codon:yes stop_codon:yes gene_type:complete